MKRTAKIAFIILLCTCFAVMALPSYGASPIPTLNASGSAVSISEAEKDNLARLFSAANPSDLLLPFGFEENIDQVMWLAGFAAWFYGGEAGPDSDLFEADAVLSEEAQAHFAGLWAEYFDGWKPLGEVSPPADILPYSIDGTVRDSLYYRVENERMQALVRGIYGREMVAPEKHTRFYDGGFYFGHIGDIEECLWFGYDYTVDRVYALSDAYYSVEGTAAYYDYATGILEDKKAYGALVKKDAAADYGYFLIAQMFSDYGNAD